MAVYLIGNEAKKELKIGYSENPETRLKALQTGCSDTLSLLQVLPYSDRRMEEVLHCICSNYRIRGEWFLDSKWIRAYFYCLWMAQQHWSMERYLTYLEISDDEIEKELEGNIVRIDPALLEEHNKPDGDYIVLSAYQTKQKTIPSGQRLRCLVTHFKNTPRTFIEEIAHRRKHLDGRFLTRKYLLNSGAYDLKCTSFSCRLVRAFSPDSVQKRLSLLKEGNTVGSTQLPYIFRDDSPLFGWEELQGLSPEISDRVELHKDQTKSSGQQLYFSF